MIDPVKAAKIRAEVKRRDCYQRLISRKFAPVKGYKTFEEIALIMALNLEIAEIGLELSGHRWVWLCACDMFGRAIVDNQFPVYRVDKELTELLLETEEPKQFKNELPRPIDSALFLLPDGLINVGKWCINWVLVDIIDQTEAYQEYKFTQETIGFQRLSETDLVRYRWITQTHPTVPNTPGDIFISTFGFDRSQSELETEYITKTPDDKLVTALISKLVKNLLLWLYKPRECEYVESHRGRGFGGSNKPIKEPKRYPIKLGIDEQPRRIYRPPAGQSDRPSSTQRRSPLPHRRKSHWRRVPVGKREENRRELRLIRQANINQNKD